MALKWTGSHSESGILRKSEYKEKKEDLFVFGYSCKLFRDDEKALHIDQGKHLIPWMGDESLKIDRYDARGALHDLSTLEAPPGGYDWRIELTRGELDVEQLCDEERYRALHTDEDEEEMYKEEELKRLHAAGYGQVGFNYDSPQEPEQPQPAEVDEPFVPTPSFKALFSTDIVMPDSEKQNAIIEKTAKFIASQGAQMEILIKTKQGDNPQFKFLNRDSVLHPYYTALIALVKAGKWPEKKPEVVEEKPPEPDEYLHPSLASTIIESAPSIPSIHYRPSADCDYTMLISKMRGETTLDEVYAPELAPGEVAPPGTEPLPPRVAAQISRAPVMYNRNDNHTPPIEQPPPAQPPHQQYAAYYAQCKALQVLEQENKPKAPASPVKSTGLSLMKNYATDSESDDSDTDDTSSTDSKEQIAIPPEDVKVVIDKMAAYVARNGDEFAEIVRAKNDPRFTFLEPDNVYHPFYKRLMQQKRGGTGQERPKRSGAPLSFSIKKMKGPDPILPKPALPYESSSDEDSEKQADKAEDKEPVKSTAPPTFPVQNMPPVVVYKMESVVNSELPTVKTIEAKVVHPAPVVKEVEKKVEEPPVVENNVPKIPKIEEPKKEVVEEVKVPEPEIEPAEEIKEIEVKNKEREKERSPRREKRKHKDRKKEYRSKSETRERKEMKSVDREERRERKRDKEEREKRDKEEREKRHKKDDLENEIISLDDNSDDLVDLTGDLSDSKVSADCETDRLKQQERRRRAAEFLKKVGVEPSAANAMPANSLASAMVDTLESIRKKKAEEEEKRRRRDKRRHRDRHDYEDGADKSHRKSKRRKYKSSDEENGTDVDGKKKKRKKDKKHKNKKKRRREVEEEEEDHPLNIDLTTTLKELRTASPTKQLELQQDLEESQHSIRQESSSSEEEKPKKKEREYSEGEWSSDSEQDSESDHSKND